MTMLGYGIISIMVFIIYRIVDSTQSVQLINILINKIKIFQNWNDEKYSFVIILFSQLRNTIK